MAGSTGNPLFLSLDGKNRSSSFNNLFASVWQRSTSEGGQRGKSSSKKGVYRLCHSWASQMLVQVLQLVIETRQRGR